MGHAKDRRNLTRPYVEITDSNGTKHNIIGRCFNIEGREIELFPIKALLLTLDRKADVIYIWERDESGGGINFPKPSWVVTDDTRTKRWYSKKQLEAIKGIYDHIFLDPVRNKYKQVTKDKLKLFSAAVRRVIYNVDLENHEIGQPTTTSADR